jgi:general secretion pathway protein J
LDEWIQADRLPRLIKISIVLDDKSFWPDMVFSPKINALPSVESVADDEAAPENDAETQ